MANKTRLGIAGLTLSAAAFVGVLTREGYSGTAVIPTKHDVPTVGFGTTRGVQLGDRMAPLPAVQRALADVNRFEQGLKHCVRVPLNQTEYDVYSDLIYNIGEANFCTDPTTGKPAVIPRRLNALNYRGACAAILLYRYAGGFDCAKAGNTRCAGVWTDRQRLYALCMGSQ
jgi:lysozyme